MKTSRHTTLPALSVSPDDWQHSSLFKKLLIFGDARDQSWGLIHAGWQVTCHPLSVISKVQDSSLKTVEVHYSVGGVCR